MPALFETPGPVDCHVRFAGEGASYLGTCVVTPEYEGIPSYIPIMNDLAGRSVPMANLYDGEIHRVSMVMNRFDYVVYRRLRDQPSHQLPGAGAGIDYRYDRGTIVTGRFDVQLIFANSFYGSTNNNVNSPVGRMYYTTLLNGYKESSAGTRVTEIALLFECHNLFVSESRGFQLYTEDPSQFPFLTVN
jgi:hypothetical protein